MDHELIDAGNAETGNPSSIKIESALDYKDNTVKYATDSSDETFRLGVRLGQNARPGDVYALIGDLGVGKTVLAQGIASGLGITEPICSPTFTIVQVYDEGRIPLYHFDVYRIGDVEEMDEIGYEEYLYGDGLCLVEWADMITELLPPDCLVIRIEKDIERGYDYRRIQIGKICERR